MSVGTGGRDELTWRLTAVPVSGRLNELMFRGGKMLGRLALDILSMSISNWSADGTELLIGGGPPVLLCLEWFIRNSDGGSADGCGGVGTDGGGDGDGGGRGGGWEGTREVEGRLLGAWWLCISRWKVIRLATDMDAGGLKRWRCGAGARNSPPPPPRWFPAEGVMELILGGLVGMLEGSAADCWRIWGGGGGSGGGWGSIACWLAAGWQDDVVAMTGEGLGAGGTGDCCCCCTELEGATAKTLHSFPWNPLYNLV